MKERNRFLEDGGLYFESETHEWFRDKGSTSYAQREKNGISLPNIFCFVIREKSSGDYNRVVMDSESNSIIYENGNLEEIGSFIDRLKMIKRFKDEG
jgi:hypothetical protein